MENKLLLPVLSFALLLLHFPVWAAPTIGDISNSQQNTIMLKSALERAKLEKELSDMKDVKVSSAELCTNKGIGMLSLKAVYGVGKKRYASFNYNASSIVEAQVGERLLCGEKVRAIRLGEVEVEKDSVIYTLSGSSHAIKNK
ncbi:MAG TPA: hypothetical protein VGL07_13485 [Buttiauxella sp.]